MFRKNRIVTSLLFACMLCFCLASIASAHAALAESAGGTLVKFMFSDGTTVKGARIIVYDANQEQIGKGKVDKEGIFDYAEYAGTCHLENLGDRDGVLKAKTEIFQSMQPSGHIVLNGDDDKLATVDGYHGVKPVFFGLDAKRDVYADQIVSRGLKGVSCRIHMGEDAFDVLVPTPGIHMVYNALAAAAVGRIYGLTIEEIKRGIESLETIRGRFKMIETENFLVVDDCYNANPMSMKASLDVLHDGEGRRVAILGDMGELGENEISLHEEVGEHAAKCGIDVCICVGELSSHIAEAARKADPDFEVHYEKDRESLLKNLGGYVHKGDTILVKASHFMKFEEVVDALEKM